MRAHALEQGFTLNEYTLRPVGSTGKYGTMTKNISNDSECPKYRNFKFREKAIN